MVVVKSSSNLHGKIPMTERIFKAPLNLAKTLGVVGSSKELFGSSENAAFSSTLGFTGLIMLAHRRLLLGI